MIPEYLTSEPPERPERPEQPLIHGATYAIKVPIPKTKDYAPLEWRIAYYDAGAEAFIAYGLQAELIEVDDYVWLEGEEMEEPEEQEAENDDD